MAKRIMSRKGDTRAFLFYFGWMNNPPTASDEMQGFHPRTHPQEGRGRERTRAGAALGRLSFKLAGLCSCSPSSNVYTDRFFDRPTPRQQWWETPSLSCLLFPHLSICESHDLVAVFWSFSRYLLVRVSLHICLWALSNLGKLFWDLLGDAQVLFRHVVVHPLTWVSLVVL